MEQRPEQRPARKPRTLIELRVHRTERLTPHMIRVVAGGENLTRFAHNGYTDAYVKLLFPQPGVTYPEPFDMDTIRATLPRDQWPRTRTYTVRALDPEARELTIDFVHHGDEGIAGPWAAAARPGDRLLLLGPGGAYAPAPDADWHLFAGDESALPAIAASLARVPHGAPAHAVIEVATRADEQPLPTPGDLSLTWLHRDDPAAPTLLDAVRALEFLPGVPHAFVHGEAGTMKELRRHLLDERGVTRDRLSLSGYWRQGRDEDGFQADKAAERQAATTS